MKSIQHKTWGDVYRAALRRGYDHGYAAYLADQWERKTNKKLLIGHWIVFIGAVIAVILLVIQASGG